MKLIQSASHCFFTHNLWTRSWYCEKIDVSILTITILELKYCEKINNYFLIMITMELINPACKTMKERTSQDITAVTVQLFTCFTTTNNRSYDEVVIVTRSYVACYLEVIRWFWQFTQIFFLIFFFLSIDLCICFVYFVLLVGSVVCLYMLLEPFIKSIFGFYLL